MVVVVVMVLVVMLPVPVAKVKEAILAILIIIMIITIIIRFDATQNRAILPFYTAVGQTMAAVVAMVEKMDRRRRKRMARGHGHGLGLGPVRRRRHFTILNIIFPPTTPSCRLSSPSKRQGRCTVASIPRARSTRTVWRKLPTGST